MWLLFHIHTVSIPNVLQVKYSSKNDMKNMEQSILSYIHCIRFAFQWLESEHLFWQCQKTIQHSEQSCHIDCVQIYIHIDGILSVNNTSLVAIFPAVQGKKICFTLLLFSFVVYFEHQTDALAHQSPIPCLLYNSSIKQLLLPNHLFVGFITFWYIHQPKYKI